MTYYFPAIIKKTATGYHVRYVDLQDCFGEGATLDEALDEAREAGVNYILTELETDMDLPTRTLLMEAEQEQDSEEETADGEEKTDLALVMPRDEQYDSFG